MESSPGVPSTKNGGPALLCLQLWVKVVRNKVCGRCVHMRKLLKEVEKRGLWCDHPPQGVFIFSFLSLCLCSLANFKILR